MSSQTPGNVIKQELFKFKQLFDDYSDDKIPVLLFPSGMDEVLMKGIRIIASKYNMASMYVEDYDIKSVVVFHAKNLKLEYQHDWYKFFPETFTHSDIERLIGQIMEDRGLKREPELITDDCGYNPTTPGLEKLIVTSSSISSADNNTTGSENVSDTGNVQTHSALNYNHIELQTETATPSCEVVNDNYYQREDNATKQSCDQPPMQENQHFYIHRVALDDSGKSSVFYESQSLQFQDVTVEIDCAESCQNFKDNAIIYSNLKNMDQSRNIETVFKNMYQLNLTSTVQMQIYIRSDNCVKDLEEFNKSELYDEMLMTTQAVRKTISEESDINILNVDKIYDFVKNIYNGNTFARDAIDTDIKFIKEQDHTNQDNKILNITDLSLTATNPSIYNVETLSLCDHEEFKTNNNDAAYELYDTNENIENKQDTNETESNKNLELNGSLSTENVNSESPIQCILNTENSGNNAFGSWGTVITINDQFSTQIKNHFGRAAFVVLATENYLPYKSLDYLKIVELYDINLIVSTEYILCVYSEVLPICKWLDKNRAILILQSEENVAKALNIKDNFIKSRSIFYASSEAIVAALTKPLEHVVPMNELNASAAELYYC